jgi:hypothetical protein
LGGMGDSIVFALLLRRALDNYILSVLYKPFECF